MKISCLMPSHNKPDYVHHAINGVMSQIHQDWTLTIMDSGVLFDAGYYDAWTDSRIKVIKTGETEETRACKAMAPWCFNECFRRGLVTGDLVVYHGDDDVLYPHAYAVFNKWATNNPDLEAFYASVDLAFYVYGEEPLIYGKIPALEIGGNWAYRMDCRVDSLQLCHRRSVLERFNNNEKWADEYWPESLDTAHHADGVFMERLGLLCPIYPIPDAIGQNRRTPCSTYAPYKKEEQ